MVATADDTLEGHWKGTANGCTCAKERSERDNQGVPIVVNKAAIQRVCYNVP